MPATAKIIETTMVSAFSKKMPYSARNSKFVTFRVKICV
jgi:hypothetical protein